MAFIVSMIRFFSSYNVRRRDFCDTHIKKERLFFLVGVNEWVQNSLIWNKIIRILISLSQHLLLTESKSPTWMEKLNAVLGADIVMNVDLLAKTFHSPPFPCRRPRRQEWSLQTTRGTPPTLQVQEARRKTMSRQRQT